ncbi:hypothetical protein ILYODFUR_005071 [Ilyodon furcidens]|uniref:Uncharacterized protein n=1 Tax=Ilyodon furcidens TaxID=33524 RepID=A0ABV0VCW3_9TELE
MKILYTRTRTCTRTRRLPLHPGLGRNGSRLSKDTQTSLSPDTISSSSGGSLKCSQASQEMIFIPAASHSAANCPSTCCSSWLEGASRTTSSAKKETKSTGPQTRPPPALGCA